MNTISRGNHLIPYYNAKQLQYALNISEQNIKDLLIHFVLKKNEKLFSMCMDLQRHIIMKTSIINLDWLENSSDIELAKDFNRFYNLNLSQFNSFDTIHTTPENRTKILANFDVPYFMDFLDLVASFKISEKEKRIFNENDQTNKNIKRDHQSRVLKSFNMLKYKINRPKYKINLDFIQDQKSDFYFDYKPYLISVKNGVLQTQGPNWEQLEPLLETFLQAKSVWEQDKKTWIDKKENDQKETLFQKMQWITKKDWEDSQTITHIFQNDSFLEQLRLDWQRIKTEGQKNLQRLRNDFFELQKTQERYLTIIRIGKMILSNLDQMKQDVSVYFENQEKNIKSLQGFGAYNFLTKISKSFNRDVQKNSRVYFKIIDALKEDFTGGIEGIEIRMKMKSMKEVEKKICSFIPEAEKELYDLTEDWEKSAQENPLRFLITFCIQ